jgi:1-acyl-sn-glycerol-3-phosphate acyltransferase
MTRDSYTHVLTKFYAWRSHNLKWLLLAIVLFTIMSACGVPGLHFEGGIAGIKQFALWTIFLLTAIIYFSLGAIELAGATLLPLAFGALWTFGAMGWLKLPFARINGIFGILTILGAAIFSALLVTNKLDVWRGHPSRFSALKASIALFDPIALLGFALVVFMRHALRFSAVMGMVLSLLFTFFAILILTPLCMDLLLFKDQPRGAPRWWHLIGTLWIAIHLGGSELVLYYVLRPILKLVSPRNADSLLRRATSWAARGVVKGLPFGKLDFQNLTRETFSPPCIVISNHQSAVDVMLLVTMPADVRQTAKKRIFDTPILGIGCKLLGHVLVEPNDPETTLRRCRERLAEGASVHFYPEGTRSQDGWVQRFLRGAFELAVELNQDILPIVLCDTHTAMPRDSYWFEPYHVTVRALPRITPRNFDYSQGGLALLRHCRTLVREGLQQQLNELNTPRVVRRKVRRLYRYQGKFVEQFVFWKLKLDPMFEVLDAVVPREGFILDLGCGYGLAAHWLACFTDRRTVLAVDYDEDKIRVAQRTAPHHTRVKFEVGNLLNCDLPECDAVLLLDVLHYWQPEKQQLILNKVRQALRPGGRLILREAAAAGSKEHRRVHFWERIATRAGHNRTSEGLHFQSLPEIEAALRRAGFASWQVRPGAGRDSNVLLVAVVGPTQHSGAQNPETPRAAGRDILAA